MIVNKIKKFLGKFTYKKNKSDTNVLMTSAAPFMAIKLGLEGWGEDPVGITDLIADYANAAFDFVINALRVVLYVVLTIPLMITSVLSDAVDIISGIRPIRTAENAIAVPYAGTLPPCAYDDFVVFDSFYMEIDVVKSKFNSDGYTRNPERYAFLETLPTPIVGSWVAYDWVPSDEDMEKLYYMMPADVRDGVFIDRLLGYARHENRMLNFGYVQQGGWSLYRDFPDSYTLPEFGGRLFYGGPVHIAPADGVWHYSTRDWLDPGYRYVKDWKEPNANNVYRFTSNQDFAQYYIAKRLYINGYEPSNYDFSKNPDLIPYYMSNEDAFNLTDNRLNEVLRGKYGKWQFGGYKPDFFMHVQCRQQVYYVEATKNLVSAIKNYYSVMALYSAKPIWRDCINNLDGVAHPQRRYTHNPNQWEYWTDDFREIMRENNLAPGSEAMYRFTANRMFEGNQLYTSPQESSGEGETLLSILFGQSVISYVFWGVTLISLALCLFFTIIAVSRSVMDLNLRRPVGRIMGDTGKAMLTFLLVPFLMIVTINLSSAVLRQINILMDSAITGQGGGYQVNLASSILYTAITPDSMLFTREEDAVLRSVAGTDQERVIRRTGYTPTESEKNLKYNRIRKQLLEGTLRWENSFSIPVNDVDPLRMNYIPATVAAWFSVVIMTMILVLFIRRIYDLLLLYLVAPLFVSVIPLDEGQKFASWREMFLAKAIEGFSSIITLKLFLIFMPLLWNGGLSFHENGGYDLIIKCLFMIGALFAVYKSHTMITGLFSRQAEGMEKETAEFANKTIVGGAKKAAMYLPNKVINKAKEKVGKKIDDVKNKAVDGAAGAVAGGINKAVGGVASGIGAGFKAAGKGALAGAKAAGKGAAWGAKKTGIDKGLKDLGGAIQDNLKGTAHLKDSGGDQDKDKDKSNSENKSENKPKSKSSGNSDKKK